MLNKPAKDWDVPKLYQHDVPNIGGVICSPTTTTMLLKFMGMSFKDKGYTYEHEYIARMAADPGHNSPTYGNWSYNMITAGALGATAYWPLRILSGCSPSNLKSALNLPSRTSG